MSDDSESSLRGTDIARLFTQIQLLRRDLGAALLEVGLNARDIAQIKYLVGRIEAAIQMPTVGLIDEFSAISILVDSTIWPNPDRLTKDDGFEWWK
jgi:hypothetical protein